MENVDASVTVYSIFPFISDIYSAKWMKNKSSLIGLDFSLGMEKVLITFLRAISEHETQLYLSSFFNMLKKNKNDHKMQPCQWLH